MILKLDIERLTSVEAIRDFMMGSAPIDFQYTDRKDAYEAVRRLLVRLDYIRLPRPDKGLVRGCIGKLTGLSRAQVTRLISQYRQTGQIQDRRRGPSKPFQRRYSSADIRLLAAVDEQLGGLCSALTRRFMQQQYERHGDVRFQRLAYLSHGHLYRLRQSRTYRQKRNPMTRTRPTSVAIGERRKPRPGGQPGFLRIDSVHQGDLDGRKGLYQINIVDTVTQYQFIAAVRAISERFMIPALQQLLAAFPFNIKGFHADNGSEYVNWQVATMLDRLHIEFTRSRPRHSNDNALVESKNAAVVRHYLGHSHIPSHHADRVNRFLKDQLAPFINYHRPCHFPVDSVDGKGRQRKRYPYEQVTTPYLKLKSLTQAEQYLRDGVTFEQLDRLALATDGWTAAQNVKQARDQLFLEIQRLDASVA